MKLLFVLCGSLPFQHLHIGCQSVPQVMTSQSDGFSYIVSGKVQLNSMLLIIASVPFSNLYYQRQMLTLKNIFWPVHLPYYGKKEEC